MHLEKVTTRSSEAGLAGWIASNDVTLFTMALVMVIAIFLHTKLNKGALEHRQLSSENAAISASLATTASELDSARDLLDRTAQSLQLTQEERDQLQQQLVEKLAALASLNDKLEALLATNGELETQRRTLLASQESLTQEKASLTSDRSSLTGANSTLRDRLDALSAQLAEKVAALQDIEAQRDRLAKQSDELGAIVASLKQRLKEMNIDLVAARDQAETARAASESSAQALQAKVAAGDKQAEEYLAQLKRAATLLHSLQATNQQLVNDLSEAEKKRQEQLLAEAENNRELVGLKGPVQRVAIVFDASGSMKQPGSGGGDRWVEAQSIASTWLQHLNVEQCVLIVFSSDVRTFPQDGTFADLRGADGKTKRDGLLRELKAITPGGWTNTYDALRKAYEYNVDTVLLFSDGAPSKVASGLYDDALARQIYELCRKHPGIPVNAIGLGNYFDKDTSTFLRTIASITGGAFRGE
jgi:predicted nuclease with TOPRIM domain